MNKIAFFLFSIKKFIIYLSTAIFPETISCTQPGVRCCGINSFPASAHRISGVRMYKKMLELPGQIEFY